MSARRYTFDTNILFYAIDPASPQKHARAQHLLASASSEHACLLLQTLGELANAVARKRPAQLASTQKWILEIMSLFDIVAAQTSDLLEAIQTQQQHHLPFWDALLCATARRSGCTLLLTEDMQDGRTLGTLTIHNPFLLSEAELATLLA